jgi:hypothetical protein
MQPNLTPSSAPILFVCVMVTLFLPGCSRKPERLHISINSAEISANDERNLAGLVYTDRPVYRLGDTMHFRGILRQQLGVGYNVPAGQTFSVEVMDPDGKAISQKSLTANSNGILHDELPLARNAALGNYFVQVRSGENLIAGNFEVQEYKKPEYGVRVLPEKPPGQHAGAGHCGRPRYPVPSACTLQGSDSHPSIHGHTR